MIQDIEEITAELQDGSSLRKSFGVVPVKQFHRKNKTVLGSTSSQEKDDDKNNTNQEQNDDTKAETSSETTAVETLTKSDLAASNCGFLPGKATVFVKTWGCGHNNSDGEYMAGLLAAQGYNIILDHQKAQSADVWVLNSCTVKGPSQQTFVNDIQKGKDAGIKVVVAGCVPQAAPKGSEWTDLSMIGVQQIDKVVDAVEETLKGNTVQYLKEAKEISQDGSKRKAGGARLDLPKIRRNPYIEIIPINTGCLNQCTYCKTKHARGDLGSYHPDEIISRVNTVLDEGVKEIWLTSEDTGAYGKDIGVSIVTLLRGIVEAMDAHRVQDAMLRVGMTNPPYILEHIEDIAEILKHPKVYAFLHVPIQAGSTKVLSDMRRQYTREEFEKVVDTLKERVPGVTIATDIICGFPTETDEDFEQTMEVLRKYEFPVLHISQFYPRPGTPAAKMKRLPTQTVKQRSRQATAFFDSYIPYSNLLNSIHTGLVTETSSDGLHYIAHNKYFHHILVDKDDRFMGRQIQVKIIEVGKFFMKGQILPECLAQLEATLAAQDSQITEIEQKRIPKLVKVWRGMSTLSSTENDPGYIADEEVEEDVGDSDNATTSILRKRADGAELSLGKNNEMAKSVLARSSSTKSTGRSSSSPLLMQFLSHATSVWGRIICFFILFAVISFSIPDMRWLVQIAVSMVMTVIIESILEFEK